MMVHFGVRFTCNLCSRSFSTDTYLRKHKKKHTANTADIPTTSEVNEVTSGESANDDMVADLNYKHSTSTHIAPTKTKSSSSQSLLSPSSAYPSSSSQCTLGKTSSDDKTSHDKTGISGQ